MEEDAYGWNNPAVIQAFVEGLWESAGAMIVTREALVGMLSRVGVADYERIASLLTADYEAMVERTHPSAGA